MRLMVKKFSLFLTLVMAAAVLTACNSHEYAKGESKLIEAKELSGLAGAKDSVIVDMRSAEEYADGHVLGAVNIPVSDIVINVPVKNMLTSEKKIQKVLSAAGISNDTRVLAYDADKMSAARMLWTLFMYGHENVMVINGGIDAIQKAGIALTQDIPEIVPAVFEAREPGQNWLATMKEVAAIVNEPDPNIVLLDVRSDAEYTEFGKIPGSIMMDYLGNYYADGTLKNVQTTRINYLSAGIQPEQEIIIYCQTSFRAAPVFLELYNAGYRNIRIYDGAFLEWTSNSANPVEMPEGGADAPKKQDAS